MQKHKRLQTDPFKFLMKYYLKKIKSNLPLLLNRVFPLEKKISNALVFVKISVLNLELLQFHTLTYFLLYLSINVSDVHMYQKNVTFPFQLQRVDHHIISL